MRDIDLFANKYNIESPTNSRNNSPKPEISNNNRDSSGLGNENGEGKDSSIFNFVESTV